ncbi:hypothetical protein SBOR_10162 [Sclerotinia borealis F-4128]|uniref:Uncharacterized protein n=1 Tax=Sclerotinia borealis (strain F-4128) TaxID=1432307 RepID=W9C3F6_SCLBF|nr:hypothetical protein SBOR_10162 [Sclerotinia borealis F-4128]
MDSKVTAPTKPQLKAIRKLALALEIAILVNQKPKDNPKEEPAPDTPTPTPTPISTPKHRGGWIAAYENLGNSVMKTQLYRSAVAIS